MTEEELDRLIAMLQPGCDEKTLRFVKRQFSRTGFIRQKNELSDQQSVDPYEWPLANDPRYW